MKGIITIALIAIIAATTSCNKEGDWICACNVDGVKTDIPIYDTKKKEAKSKCRDLENNTSISVTGCRITGQE